MIKQSFQGYRFKSGIVIFAWRVSWNYAYSPFNILTYAVYYYYVFICWFKFHLTKNLVRLVSWKLRRRMQIENTVSFEEICNLSQNCSFFKICMVVYHFSVLRIRIRWIRKIWASWIRIQWAKYQLKNEEKKFYTQNPNLNYWKKRDYKNFLISEWFIRFQHKNKRKNTTKNLEILLC